jgi:hypothetical protein
MPHFFSGMAQFVSHFAEPGDPEYAPPIKEAETPVGLSTCYTCSLIFFFCGFYLRFFSFC